MPWLQSLLLRRCLAICGIWLQRLSDLPYLTIKSVYQQKGRWLNQWWTAVTTSWMLNRVRQNESRSTLSLPSPGPKQWIAGRDSWCWSCRVAFQGRLPRSSRYRVSYERGERSFRAWYCTVTGVLWSYYKRWDSNAVHVVSCRAASQRLSRQLQRNC